MKRTGLCQRFKGEMLGFLLCSLLGLISMAGFALTLLVMLNAFRHHNEYVTRPVPFFGEEGSNE